MGIISLVILITTKLQDSALGIQIPFNIQGKLYCWTKSIAQKCLTVSFVSFFARLESYNYRFLFLMMWKEQEKRDYECQVREGELSVWAGVLGGGSKSFQILFVRYPGKYWHWDLSRGLIYKMLRRNHTKFDLKIISKICVRAIQRMNVRTEIAHTRLFQMCNLWIANDLELARNLMVSALCLVDDS